MSELLNGIFECLDINSGTGLATEDNLQSMTSFQRLFYTQVHEKIGIDAVYFLRDVNGIAKVPLIYFSVIQKYDAKQVAELHRLSWNLGEAPLLFVVTPDEILIYNNYETPQVIENGNLDPTAGIIETLSLTDGLVSQQLALKKYHRSLLESGEYWRQSMTRFNAQNRVDATLISNLRIMRRTLINQISKRCDKSKEIITGVVHALLSRSIFIKYLEERKDSNGETVFPQDFYCNFMESAKWYTDVLNSKEATYNLFLTLKDKFNGDTLQVSEIETEIITQDDLDELRTFILGNSELESRQLTLWPLYSFDIIPIQLISSIYELFFHLSDEEDEKGTYYTPLHLVNLVMPDILISSGGALVKYKTEYIYRAEFSEEETNVMIDMARNICGNDCEITIDTIDAHYWNYKIDPKKLDKSWGDSIYTDFSDFNECSLKMCVEIFNQDKADKLTRSLSDCDCIRFSDGFWYKFTKKNVTKENAIMKITEVCGFSTDSIIAFGDDYADIGMLELCGTGVAMGNAIDEVKERADIVIGSNDEDGIAGFIENEIL